MSATYPTISTLPAVSSQKTTMYRQITLQFGDGYMQNAPDGINNVYYKWDVKYENVKLADRNTLQTFFDSIGLWSWFSWTAPGDSVARKWKITTAPVETSVGANIYTISVSYTQVFDLT